MKSLKFQVLLSGKTLVLLLFLMNCTGKTRNTADGNPQGNVEQTNDSLTSIEGLSNAYKDLDTDEFLGEVTIETIVEDEREFTEGPAVDGNGMVYFSNVPVNKILKWDPVEKNLSVFKSNSNGANGLRFTPEGNLLVCEGDSGRIIQIDMSTGTEKTLASTYNGKKLQSPNDLDYDSSGRIYFSSRTDNPDFDQVNKKALYRLDPDGSVHQLLVEPEVEMPNGVVVSPDNKTLYMIEAHSGLNRARKILAVDLDSDGSVYNRRTLFDFYPGRSGDGMAIDIEGNLYVAAGLHAERGTSETLDTRPGIHVISPKGELLAYVETPQAKVTNCTFGGEDLKTLYVTDGKYLLSIPTQIPGKPSYRPNTE